MGLVVGAGRSARLIVARDKLDMTASGQKPNFRSAIESVCFWGHMPTSNDHCGIFDIVGQMKCSIHCRFGRSKAINLLRPTSDAVAESSFEVSSH
jgi:hypothetical protein